MTRIMIPDLQVLTSRTPYRVVYSCRSLVGRAIPERGGFNYCLFSVCLSQHERLQIRTTSVPQSPDRYARSLEEGLYL